MQAPGEPTAEFSTVQLPQEILTAPLTIEQREMAPNPEWLEAGRTAARLLADAGRIDDQRVQKGGDIYQQRLQTTLNQIQQAAEGTPERRLADYLTGKESNDRREVWRVAQLRLNLLQAIVYGGSTPFSLFVEGGIQGRNLDEPVSQELRQRLPLARQEASAFAYGVASELLDQMTAGKGEHPISMSRHWMARAAFWLHQSGRATTADTLTMLDRFYDRLIVASAKPDAHFDPRNGIVLIGDLEELSRARNPQYSPDLRIFLAQVDGRFLVKATPLDQFLLKKAQKHLWDKALDTNQPELTDGTGSYRRTPLSELIAHK